RRRGHGPRPVPDRVGHRGGARRRPRRRRPPHRPERPSVPDPAHGPSDRLTASIAVPDRALACAVRAHRGVKAPEAHCLRGLRCASIGLMGTVPSTLDTGVLRRLRLARDTLDREWAEPLDVAAVAARAGYSRYHFGRLFNEVDGETPGAYAARRRIRRGQDRLRTPPRPRAGSSRYHCARLFNEVSGETPGAYLARRRIERAQDLLRTANLTVTEICMLVGFTSLGTFSTRFKQQVGTTPTEYRRRARATD